MATAPRTRKPLELVRPSPTSSFCWTVTDGVSDALPLVPIPEWPFSKSMSNDIPSEFMEDMVVVPLPAYGLNNDAIPPSEYRRRLEGALVELHFHIECWRIPPKYKDGSLTSQGTVTPLVVVNEINVLRPPGADQSGLQSPSKRKAAHLADDGDAVHASQPVAARNISAANDHSSSGHASSSKRQKK